MADRDRMAHLSNRLGKTTRSVGSRKAFWGYGVELHDPDGYVVRLWDERTMKEKGDG